jgi:hypothetical protein
LLTGSRYSVNKLNVRRSFDVKGGTLNLNPSFDISNKDGNLRVGYSLNDVGFNVDASRRKQRVSVSQLFGKDKKTQVTPMVSLQGDVSIAVRQEIGDDASITATVTPKESISIRWEDGPWQAIVNAPMEGYLFEGGVDVSVKRKVDFL